VFDACRGGVRGRVGVLWVWRGARLRHAGEGGGFGFLLGAGWVGHGGGEGRGWSALRLAIFLAPSFSSRLVRPPGVVGGRSSRVLGPVPIAVCAPEGLLCPWVGWAEGVLNLLLGFGL